MDIEQLKMIVDLFGTVTGQAKEVAIWYFVLHYGMMLLGKIGFVIVAAALFYTVYRLALLLKEAQDEDQYLRQIRQVLFPSMYGHVSQHEFQMMYDQIVKLKQKQN